MPINKPTVDAPGWNTQADLLFDRVNEFDAVDPTALATDAEVSAAVSAHVAAGDPHGDRAYADTQDAAHVAAGDPHAQYLTEAAAATAYQAVPSTWIDAVAEYGMVGDGVTDNTVALQDAIDDCVAAGGGTVWVKDPGVYLISGSQQTGTVFDYTYSGQILFPARTFAQGRAYVRILGPNMAPQPFMQFAGEPPTVSTAVLKSTATSGSVFDAIPGNDRTDDSTNLFVEFANLAVRLPDDPQVDAAINAKILSCFRAIGISVDVDADGQDITYPTGTGYGIVMPYRHNQAYARLENCQVGGFPVGISVGEHTHLSGVTVQKCAVGLRMQNPAQHAAHCDLLLSQECTVTIQARDQSSDGGYITGVVHHETELGGTWECTAVVDDAGNRIYGSIEIINISGDQAAGFPINGMGSNNLTLRPIRWGSPNPAEVPPFDTCERFVDVAAVLGTCSRTGHAWRILSGTWTTSGSHLLTSSTTVEATAYVQWVNRFSAGSYILHATMTTQSGSYNIGLVHRNASNGNKIIARLNGGTVAIIKEISGTRTTMATSAAAAVAASTTYDVKLVMDRPIVGSWTATVLINNVEVVSYTLDATERTQLTESGTSGNTHSGIRTNNDTSSYVSMFKCLPGVA